ncbi:MAG: endonuclease Q family protein [Methanomicrobiales archaeon]|nr:endonuclease Q family protein [Methanomicrobiales archaeon]
MDVNADLHIHSPFSMAVSPRMTPPALLDACAIKGIGVLATGDAFHPEWRLQWGDFLENDAGVIVVPSAEVEDRNRVHHLILAPEMDIFANCTSRMAPFSKNMVTGGRPQVRLSGGEIARIIHEEGGHVGPAHAFTPWTGIYAHFNTLHGCYGGETADYLELGLSADSSYGAGISELRGVPFLSNSDAHSPSPAKIGREFNRIRIGRGTVGAVIGSVLKGDIVMNAGYFPEEGKYNRTACTRCFTRYSPAEADALAWRCPLDGGRIKKGVRDRARELTDAEPLPRPPYCHIIPLGEIIRVVLGTSSPETAGCRCLYQMLIDRLGPEIGILIDIPLEEIAAVDRRIAAAIGSFREGKITLLPGGGGKYGSFSL